MAERFPTPSLALPQQPNPPRFDSSTDCYIRWDTDVAWVKHTHTHTFTQTRLIGISVRKTNTHWGLKHLRRKAQERHGPSWIPFSTPSLVGPFVNKWRDEGESVCGKTGGDSVYGRGSVGNVKRQHAKRDQFWGNKSSGKRHLGAN